MFLNSPLAHDSRVEREASTLIDAGWEVKVIARWDGKLPLSETRNGVRIRRLPAEPMLGRLASRLGKFAQRRLAGLLLTLEWRKFNRVAAKEAASEPASVWLAHDLDSLLAAVGAKRRLGGSLVYDSHELFVERQAGIGKLIWRAHERRLIGDADLVLTVGPEVADALSDRYGVSKPLVILNTPRHVGEAPAPTGVLRGRIGAGEKRIALYSGGIQAGRGLRNLVDSAAYLGEDILIAILGPSRPPSLVDELAARAEEGGLAERVKFIPPVLPGEVRVYTADADLGIVIHRNVNLSYYNALPTKLFECIGAGLPIVASDFPAMAEIVLGRRLGLAFDPEDPRSIAAAINGVLGDPARHAQMRANAIVAAEEYTWEREGAKLRDALARLGSGGGPGRQRRALSSNPK